MGTTHSSAATAAPKFDKLLTHTQFQHALQSCESLDTQQTCRYPCRWDGRKGHCGAPPLLSEDVQNLIVGACERIVRPSAKVSRMEWKSLTQVAHLVGITTLGASHHQLCQTMKTWFKDKTRLIVNVAKSVGIDDPLHTSAEDVLFSMLPFLSVAACDEVLRKIETGAKFAWGVQELLFLAGLVPRSRESVKEYLATVSWSQLLVVVAGGALLALVAAAALQGGGDPSRAVAARTSRSVHMSATDSGMSVMVKPPSLADFLHDDIHFQFVDSPRTEVEIDALKASARARVSSSRFRKTVLDEFVPSTLSQPAQPIALFTVGAPGRGKGYVLTGVQKAMGFDLSDFAVSNTDDTRSLFPEYKELLDIGEGQHGLTLADVEAASIIHGSASKATKWVLGAAIKRGNNVLVDGVGKIGSLTKRVKRVKSAGYKVVIVKVEAPHHVAHSRMLSRGRQIGRTVPEDVMIAADVAVHTPAAEAGYRAMADTFVQVENSGGAPRCLEGCAHYKH